MTKPRIQIRTEDYTADDAQRVLENLRTGRMGEGVVRYRRFGGAFALTDERKPAVVEETTMTDRAATR